MQDMSNVKRPQRVKKASDFVYVFLRAILAPALYLLYRFKFDTKTSKHIKRPCLILSNHQTIFDQFAVGVGFRFGINYIASDTIFRHGILSWFMKALGRPIPFSKGSSDFVAVKNMVSVVQEGGAIGLFPSGNRSFFGDECTIVPGTGKLAKKLGVPLVLVQLCGGFNVLPRWKAKPNKGPMYGSVTRVVSPEALAAMTSGEVDELIRQELCVDDFHYQRTAKIIYRGKRKAEYLESVLFYCPECGSMTGLCSGGNEFFCRDCGARVRINGTGFFEKVSKAEKIPGTILEWSVKQLDHVKGFDFSGCKDRPVFADANIIFSKAERAKKEELLGTGAIALYNDRVAVCGHEFHLAETTMAIIGVRKMTIFNKNNVFAVAAPFRLNLIKYMICGYHLRNNILCLEEEYYGY